MVAVAAELLGKTITMVKDPVVFDEEIFSVPPT